jgi:hypothetical protein
VSYKDKINEVCVRVLGTTIRSNDPRWNELRPFLSVHGASKITEVFETWASSLEQPPAYPLSYFLGAIKRLLAGSEPEPADVREIQEQTSLKELAAELYGINSQQAFTGKEKLALGKLLQEYGREEILAGYKDYVSPLDDFELRKAARTFTQGGADAVILQTRKYKAERKRQEELLELARKQFEATPALPAKEPEEEFFIPE